MKRKVVALMLAGMMVSSAGYAGTTVYADTNSDQNKVNKTESVYVTAKANGSVKKIKVKETLKNPGGTADIEDYSKLSNIRNTDGEETYTEKGDGSLVWQNKGEDINYEGETSEKLPVSVKVRYYLDGKEMKAKDMAGVSDRTESGDRWKRRNGKSTIYSIVSPDASVRYIFQCRGIERKGDGSGWAEHCSGACLPGTCGQPWSERL